MRLSEIKIPADFKSSIPNTYKYNKCERYYKENNKQDRYLVVNENNDNALNILKTIYKQEKEKNKDLTFEFLDDFMEYLRIQDESLKLRRK